jgi:hypothetical protein
MVKVNNQCEPPPPGEFASVCDLNVVVIADTPYIASALTDSLPAELPYFLVGHRNIAFLRRSKRCRQYFANDLSLEEGNKADFVQTIEQLGSTNSNIFLLTIPRTVLCIQPSIAWEHTSTRCPIAVPLKCLAISGGSISIVRS